MPELPEVENVRLSLQPRLLGRRIVEATLRRAEVVTGSTTAAALLQGLPIHAIFRHGKQLALVAGHPKPSSARGNLTPLHSPQACLKLPSLCIHLGMTGSLCHFSPALPVSAAACSNPGGSDDPHNHVQWVLDDGSVLRFRDPRRFGGIWTFPCLNELIQTRWQPLGLDALDITARELSQGLAGSRRPLKAALLDQTILAGLGNIYVDELLFACRLHPLTPAGSLAMPVFGRLVRLMRSLLGRAIASGGSTIRDYVNGIQAEGFYQNQLRVYGRGGQPCRACAQRLQVIQAGGRTTVFCPHCQPLG